MARKSKKGKTKNEVEAMDVIPTSAILTLEAKWNNYRRYRGPKDEVYIFHTNDMNPDECNSDKIVGKTLNNADDEARLLDAKNSLGDKFQSAIKDFRVSNEYIPKRRIYKIKLGDGKWLVAGRTAVSKLLKDSEIDELRDLHDPDQQSSMPYSLVAREPEDVHGVTPAPRRVERASRRSVPPSEGSSSGYSSSDNAHDTKATKSRAQWKAPASDSEVIERRDGVSDSDSSTGRTDYSTENTEAGSSDSESSDDDRHQAKVGPSTEPTSSKTVSSSRRPASSISKKVPRGSSMPIDREFTLVAKQNPNPDDETWCIIKNHKTESVHEKYEYVQWKFIKKKHYLDEDDHEVGVHPKPDIDATNEFAPSSSGMKLKEGCYAIEGVAPIKYLTKKGDFAWNCTVIFRLTKQTGKRYDRLMELRKKFGWIVSIKGREKVYDGPVRCSKSQFEKAGGSRKAYEDVLRHSSFGREYLHRPKKGHQAIRDGSMTASPEPALERALAEQNRTMRMLNEQLEEQNEEIDALRKQLKKLGFRPKRTK